MNNLSLLLMVETVAAQERYCIRPSPSMQNLELRVASILRPGEPASTGVKGAREVYTPFFKSSGKRKKNKRRFNRTIPVSELDYRRSLKQKEHVKKALHRQNKLNEILNFAKGTK